MNTKTFLHGLLVAVLSAVITGVSDSIANGGLPTLAQLKTIGLVALSAGLAYVSKNWLFGSSSKN